MNKFTYLQFPPRNAPGGEGGGAPALGAAPAGGGQVALPPPASGAPDPVSAAGAVAAPPGGMTPPATPWTVPDGLPARLHAENPNDFIGKITEDWRSQRQKISAFEPPKSVDAYQVEWSDKAKPFVGDGQDPRFDVARKAALAAGMPAHMFNGFMTQLYDTMADKGLLAPPVSLTSELQKFLGPEALGITDENALLEKANPIFEPIQRMVDKVIGDAKFPKGLSETVKAAALNLMDTADGMLFLKAMTDAMGAPKGLTPGGYTSAAQGVTEEQLVARGKDPRNRHDSPSFDPAFKAETDRLYREKYGS